MDSKTFTHKTAENAKPKDAPYKLSTGRGFYLLVTPKGGKLWRYDYRLNGRRKTASLGSFPDVSLKDAADKQVEFRKLIAQGIDPIGEKKRVRAQAIQDAVEQARTFEVVAREWFAKRMAGKSPRYQHQILSRLENHLFPFIGPSPIAELETKDFLAALRVTEARGALEMAHRLAQLVNQVCRYAKVAGYVKHNEAADISEALTSKGERQHRAAITDPTKIGDLLRSIDEYPGDISTRYALRILPYVFVRSSELRCATWAEIDMGKAEWVIPAGRMKMRIAHVVPLAPQVVKLLTELHHWTGEVSLLFPSPYSASRPISDVGLLNALRRLGYGREEMCIHGFRTTASTLLNEQGFRPDVIEIQLAHKEPNAIRDAYNRAEYMAERRSMMNAWADYLDSLRNTGREKKVSMEEKS